VAWLVVRPVRIRWFNWPWWSFALLAAGWVVRAWLLLDTWPWERVLASMVFYLLVVGFQEEFIFRGCVEEGLSQFGPWTAAVVAGLFFGLAHAPLALLQGASPAGALLNGLGGGVLYQLVMRWLRDKGGLAVPLLVHGLLDFVGGR
jgi:membrane protease YdiL (CAAX protease family)